jgi:hypothetical protein
MTDPNGTAPTKRGARPEKEVAANLPSESKKAFSHQQYLENREGVPYLPLKWRLAWLRAEHPQAKISTRLVSHKDGIAVFKARVELPEGGAATSWGVKAHPEAAEDHQDRSGHLDYIIEAENQALSRALEALGYGTEYAQDFDPPAENLSIPLPETIEEAPQDGIVVPLMEETGEDASEDEANQAAPAPVRPAAPPRGEVRALFEKRPPVEIRPTPAAQPVPAASAEIPAQPVPAGVVNLTVENRLRNVRDEALRLNIKQIYYEAKNKGIDENRVDNRSKELYGKPTFELDHEEAEQYLERILNAPKRRS